MPNELSYSALRQQKIESQSRFYAHLYASRDNGSFEVDKRSISSNLINKKNLPKLSIKSVPVFD
ncbi:TPA: hypothetical protein I7730_16205 [Vibrio vulnificus]|uniref:Uncharacterized protein n=1 Tax=Vibrio vulnificus TaxID=672 RepID=A0A8H9TG63_VIBVL|nr:hypothetical protein [Vibrio vulnificus]HAS8541327.1 hypothetical protein [Vibrio vulnificus]